MTDASIGVSNFNSSSLEALLPRVHVRPAANQCGFSVAGHFEKTSTWGRDDETHETCKKHGVTYMAYSPLGGNAMGGTGHVLRDPTVNKIAASHNRSAAQVALRWVTQQGVAAVTASDEIKHIASDLESFDFSLTNDEMEQLAKVR